MLGRLLGGRYQILRILGAGSFGHTYLAADTHRPDSPQCVVKHLQPKVADTKFWPVARQLFEKEAVVLEKLGTQDQIPRLLAYFEQDQNFYLVQEYIPGLLLSQALQPGTIWPIAQVHRLLEDILQVLVFVHGCGVIHRDIKPSNLIQRQGDHKFVLIDFGAVKSMQVLWQQTESVEASTAAFTIGTPGYMPPEQSQGRPCPSSDLYALGMVAIQALTGQMPSQLQFNQHGEWDWQPHIQEMMPTEWGAWLQKLVAYSTHDRFSTPQEALDALHRLTAPSSWKRVIRILKTPVQNLLPWRKGTESGLAGQSPLVASPSSAAASDFAPAALALIAKPASGISDPPSLPPTQDTGSVFISCRPVAVERQLAEVIETSLKGAGMQVIRSDQYSAAVRSQTRSALQQCQYFVLLLSPDSVQSERLLEELRTIHYLAGSLSSPQPSIIPIRIDLPFTTPLNYELRGYLQRLQQQIWQSSQPTDDLITEVLKRVQTHGQPARSDQLSETPAGLPTIPPVNVQPDAPPLPVAEPELPEGQLQAASLFYVERPPIERDCDATLQQPGALIRIKAPRQMGKTSLMARMLYQATQRGYQTVSLNLQLTDRPILADLNQLLRWLCASVSRRLQLPNQVQHHWDDLFGSKYNCTTYFEEQILPKVQAPLVLALDEVDRVFANPEVASDFFGLLRAWHEEAKNQEIWRHLRLIVVHATEVYIPLNIQQSPFNVGLPIELLEFNTDQVETLVQRHGLTWTEHQIEQLRAVIGGHPYLTRLALYSIARSELTLDTLLTSASSDTGLFRDHLAGHWWNLQQHPDLAAAMLKVLEANHPIPLDAVLGFKLHSLGLVRLGHQGAQLRYELYRPYLSARLRAVLASSS